ncbi:MAG: SMC-Scp complex subunit ScpB [Clostridiales Family XIII bacterium]|jgi:segregation and condensation protein B|nr:SMC-Scp complex subunit ScpB [Clostridiales Family XIII bacterium]
MLQKRDKIKSALESIMFIFGEPLDPKDAAKALDMEKEDLIPYFMELQDEYDNDFRGIRIREIAGKYQYVTIEENAEYVRAIVSPAREKKLSQAALEVLAIVAYKQPVTKAQIDSIRGVKSDRVLEGLIVKDLVKDAGRGNAIGRPILYRTTDVFLRHLNLSSIKDLPEIEDVEDVIISESDELLSMGQTMLDLE